MATTSERLALLQNRIAVKKVALADLQKVAKMEERKAAMSDKKRDRKSDARKKILIGGAMLAWMKENPKTGETIMGRLNKVITKPAERTLLGLDQIETATTSA